MSDDQTREQSAMPIEIRMPELAPDIVEADLIAWLVEPGAEVARGEPIVEIETEKSTVEIEAPADGILGEILVPGGSLGVAVGTVLGVMEASARDAEPIGEPEPPAAPSLPGPESAPNPGERAATHTAEPSRRSTALARRLADRAGLDVGSVRGSGGHGRVTKADVERGSRSRTAGTDPRTQFVRLEADCQADRLMETLRQLGAGPSGAPIPFEAVVLRAAALALRSAAPAPDAAAAQGASVELAVASAGAPGRSARIRDADRKGLAALSTEWSALGQGEPGRSEPAGSAGLRVTGLGVEGVDRHWPSPEPGSAPSLGFSPPRAQPVLREDSVAPGFVLTLTLCADAEALEADAAARLLAAIRRFIEHPLEMVL